MGDAESGPIRLSFNPQLRVEFGGATVTSDAGLLLPRELDERLGLSALIERHLTDPRTGRNYQFPLPDLFAGGANETGNKRAALASLAKYWIERERNHSLLVTRAAPSAKHPSHPHRTGRSVSPPCRPKDS